MTTTGVRDAQLDALALVNAARFGVHRVVDEIVAEIAADPDRVAVVVGTLARCAAHNADLLAARGVPVDAGMAAAAELVIGGENVAGSS